MTDSGSFDSGDLIYAADWNNLAALINTKAALAGVTGVSFSVTSATTISASNANTLVYGYQRCYNAATNMGGYTIQGVVSSGQSIAGSLFQNMWTQLNLMTFGPKWASWDESSQSGVADANTFCVMFDAASAGAADVGEGAGLTGTDATFNCDGSPNAASSYGRYNNGGGWYIPQAVADLTLQPEWTLIFKTYQFPSISNGSNVGALAIYLNHNGQYIYLVESGGGWQLTGWSGAYCQIQPGQQGAWCYHYYWRKNGYFGTGWSTTKYNTIADIPNKGTQVAGAQFTSQYTGTKEIGRWPGYGAVNCYYKYLVVSKTALLS
jgi:hypothetical protein